jgi:hypothetical protein
MTSRSRREPVTGSRCGHAGRPRGQLYAPVREAGQTRGTSSPSHRCASGCAFRLISEKTTRFIWFIKDFDRFTELFFSKFEI